MSSEKMITIGKLSNITGVHVQSLRYYERIGILTPAYIDKNSKYRYYSFSQIKIVEAIQYCVELGIPLKDFSDFLTEDKSRIDYKRLLICGKALADQKLQSLKEKMLFFRTLNDEMIHGELCNSDVRTVSRLPSKVYAVSAYSGTQAENGYRDTVIKLLRFIRANNCKTSYDSGLLSVYDGSREEHFVCVDVLNYDESLLLLPNVITVPETDFICVKRDKSDILSAPTVFEEQFGQPYKKIVIETELFTGSFDYVTPSYEIRCSLPRETRLLNKPEKI